MTIRDTSKQAQTANLTGATVNGNLLTLSFDASLANTTPNAARFSVKAAGSAIAVRSAKVKANAGTLELTLASSVKPNQSVRLSYSDLKGQSSGVLETPDGTDLASFSTSVTNANKDTKAPAVTSAFIKDKTLTCLSQKPSVQRLHRTAVGPLKKTVSPFLLSSPKSTPLPLNSICGLQALLIPAASSPSATAIWRVIKHPV